MKKIFLFSALFSAFLSCDKNNNTKDGIKFEKDNWENTLAKAKVENKIVFVDAYTTWCGPCKKMDAKTFPDKKVGDFYNKNFINIKVDAEKGDGLGIAEKYKVNSYPTLFFVNSDAELVHSSVGLKNPEELINLRIGCHNG